MTDEMTYQKNAKNAKLNVCEKCDYKSSKLSDFNRHLATQKHKILINTDGATPKTPKFNCECGKIYKHSQSLYNHKKKCNYDKPHDKSHVKPYVKSHVKPYVKPQVNKEFKNNSLINQDETKELKELVIKLMVENQEMKNIIVNENMKLQQQTHDLQKQMLDVCKNIQPNISNSNNNNNTFNLNLFLNEQCKDAMNITDFINSVTLSLNDLENMGSSGYVNGISSIIIKELRGLDITKRPVHCSDAKRETLYVKDEDKWEKECPENTKIKKAIRTVEKKNIKLISEWTDKHPKFTNSTTKENDEYLQILIETMGGKGDYEKNKNKVIKNIAKEVVIGK